MSQHQYTVSTFLHTCLDLNPDKGSYEELKHIGPYTSIKGVKKKSCFLFILHPTLQFPWYVQRFQLNQFMSSHVGKLICNDPTLEGSSDTHLIPFTVDGTFKTRSVAQSVLQSKKVKP